MNNNKAMDHLDRLSKSEKIAKGLQVLGFYMENFPGDKTVNPWEWEVSYEAVKLMVNLGILPKSEL